MADCLEKTTILPVSIPKILESDSISIVGLNNFSEGKPIKCIIHHSDDSLEEICVTHSFSSNQIEWFKFGAALNLLHNK